MAPKLLIAAGDAAAGTDQIPSAVRALIDHAGEVLVIAPRLPGRWDWISSDTDAATEQADERLAAVLGDLDQMGTPAAGQVGADDPLVAFEDAIRSFEPDHLLVALRAGTRTGWQERGLLDKLVERFGIPLTVFQLPAA
jgi:hypothetical protein